jgi:hypothetical protein
MLKLVMVQKVQGKALPSVRLPIICFVLLVDWI